MDQLGVQTLQVKAKPGLKDTKEINEENNNGAAVIRVVKDTAKVLLVDGEARWEFHYLASALRRDRVMELKSVVFVQPRIGKIAESELEKIGNPELTLPPLPPRVDNKEPVDPLTRYDCIILGDVTPEQLPLEDRRRLTFSTDGKATSFLQLDSVPEKSAQRWAEMPRHYWGVVGRTKPGAVALAYVMDDFLSPPAVGKDDKDNKETAEKRNGLIVRQHYGFGRVLFVGLDSTWRWRYKVGDAYHHRFWGQLVRWAASDRLLPAGNKYVRFGSRQPLYRQGKDAQAVDILVRLEDEVPPLPNGSLAGVRIFRQLPDGKEEPYALVPLSWEETQPRLLQGQVLNPPPGQYRIELAIPDLKLPPDAGDLPEKSAEDKKQRRDLFTVLPPDGGEMVDLATNWTLLESLANKSGGRVVTPENAASLVELLHRQAETFEHRDDQKLWQDQPLVWYVLGLFLVLLTVEWVTRKLAGLP
jgi:hypothetical protein